MSLRLLEDKVAVRPIEDPSVSKGGIWIPDEAKQRVDQGVVIYRGPWTQHVRVGDHVLFSGYTGTKITVEDEGIFVLLREIDVMAVLEDDDAEVLFPMSEIQRLVMESLAEASHEETPATVKIMEYLKDKVLTKFQEHIRAEGFEF